MRAAEVHYYKAILCENVTEFATDWRLFRWWVQGIELLGYNSQIVSVSSAHVGGPDNLHAPQWRDRIYIVFTRVGIQMPDLSPRPLAWCAGCGEDVEGVQTWRKGRTLTVAMGRSTPSVRPLRRMVTRQDLGPDRPDACRETSAQRSPDRHLAPGPPPPFHEHEATGRAA
ncbi:hypothetical protein ABT246_42600 [Streptomyces sp. NPDC001553]|uniref:hypothetical protein n=1 Tax=Streptomyces sp. NPDC001553 TaxID=3154385 RepID=UPI003331FA97